MSSPRQNEARELLQFRGVVKRLGGVPAADGLTFCVREKELAGVIGPNGAGKSTMFNLAGGELRADAGDILLDGESVSGVPAHARCRRGVARTYQIPRPFAGLTVFENALVGAVFSGRNPGDGAAESAAESALRTSGLLSRANRTAGSLTLLERKRLELARALAASPRLLLLDEIVGGLTERESAELAETVRAVHARGIAVVWIEHVLRALTAVAPRLVALDLGKVVADGETREVMQSERVRKIYMGEKNDGGA